MKKTAGHEGRESERIAFRSIVMYGDTRPPEKMSYMIDLSESGICIKTNTVYKPGTKLYMSIEVDDRSFDATGIVQWAKKVPPRLINLVKCGMGVKFLEVDRRLLNHYNMRVLDDPEFDV